MATDREIRIDYEYIKTQQHIWHDMLAEFAGGAVEHSKNLAVTNKSSVEFIFLRDMAELNQEVQEFVRQRGFEATMVSYAIAEKLAEILAWYEEGSEFSRRLERTRNAK